MLIGVLISSMFFKYDFSYYNDESNPPGIFIM